ncbi:RIO1 family protein [Ancylostoma duodenale]|uniref:non-specific serine/threonine protein kinase n=1 Tax=Ancylostoma duodenale TaxID=51022 RepID=A0A0C2GK40_9BILA|nr:RIO1 family protein [Ancylostoma duodenale]
MTLSKYASLNSPNLSHDSDDDVADFMDELGDFTKKYNAFRRHMPGPNSQHKDGTVQSSVEKAADSNAEKKRKRVKDRADRATVEQVLDPRTRLVLFRLLQRGTLSNIHGCISTGKEANVYHATDENNSLAVKIYKTSILTFKDRERYVAGEVQGHVLVMEFIGRDGWPAPLLKNATLTVEVAEKMYLQLVRDMRTLYRACKLVHADLSEYNTLVLDDRLYIIDVSQSVEHDHPHALDFLSSLDPSDDTLFMSAFIPHKLDHVLHFERDSKLLKEGQEANNPYQNIISKGPSRNDRAAKGEETGNKGGETRGSEG